MEENKITTTESGEILQHPDYKTEIVAAAKSNLAPALMKERILSYHENDVAAAFMELRPEERFRLYSILDTASLSAILEYTEPVEQYLGELNVRKRAAVLTQFEASAAAAYLSELPKQDRLALLALMPDEARREIELLGSFDEDEIGSRMTTNYISIKSGLSVREAMRELVAQAADNDNISMIYTIDDEGVFCGAIGLKDLIIAREGTPLDSIVRTSYPYVYADELTTDCLERLKDYSADSIPVLDSDNVLVGVLTASVLTELIDEEMSEDYAKLGGLSAEEDLHEPLFKSVGKRLPWLIVLLGLGMLVSSVVGIFEEVVASLSLIVCFQSLILDMAGNVGTQSLAITIRVLMDEQISLRDKLHLIGREARIGLTNGLVLGLLSFGVIGGYLMLIQHQTAATSFTVSFCTGVALMLSMLLSSVTGTTVPLIFKKLGVDPAVASGPLITTMNDLVAVVTYYGLAWLLFFKLMPV